MMPKGEAIHQDGPGEACNVCFEQGLLRHDLCCDRTETQHWFCSQCLVKLHQCPICRQQHPLCTGLPPRQTQDEELSMGTIRMLAPQNIWAHHRPHRRRGQPRCRVARDTNHIMNSTGTTADVILDQQHPSQWRYVATRLVGHMGTYTSNKIDRLHRCWHHRAAFRIREALLLHNI